MTDRKLNITPTQTMIAYLGGSAFQTVVDNPVTAYRQLVQQYAKDITGKVVDPKVARAEANQVFLKSPVGASLSGLTPRLIGVGFKRIPKFASFLGLSFFMEEKDPGLLSATFASIVSAPFINPIRMIEKQQRAYFRQTGKEKPVLEILQESAKKNFRPLLRGSTILVLHSASSATTGLVGQPQIQKYIESKLSESSTMSKVTTNLIASCIVSPIYVIMTNPLSRLEVIMQTSSIDKKKVTLPEAIKEMVADNKQFGLRGMFRGQGIGLAKAVISLSMFHLGRTWCMEGFDTYNTKFA